MKLIFNVYDPIIIIITTKTGFYKILLLLYQYIQTFMRLIKTSKYRVDLCCIVASTGSLDPTVA